MNTPGRSPGLWCALLKCPFRSLATNIFGKILAVIKRNSPITVAGAALDLPIDVGFKSETGGVPISRLSRFQKYFLKRAPDVENSIISRIILHQSR